MTRMLTNTNTNTNTNLTSASDDATPPPWGRADVPEGFDGPAEHTSTKVAVPGALVLDVSWSMHNALQEARSAMNALVTSMRLEPLVAEQARLAVITFADTAVEVLPFSAVADPKVQIPDLVARGNGTDYAAAFEAAHSTLSTGLRGLASTVDGAKQVVLRPTLYFVSDGQPNGRPHDEALARLRGDKIRPNIVAFGFGDADREVIRSIADEGKAYFAEDGQTPAAVFDQILKIILATMVTVTRAVAGGQQAVGAIDPKVDPATSGLMLLDVLDLTE